MIGTTTKMHKSKLHQAQSSEIFKNQNLPVETEKNWSSITKLI